MNMSLNVVVAVIFLVGYGHCSNSSAITPSIAKNASLSQTEESSSMTGLDSTTSFTATAVANPTAPEQTVVATASVISHNRTPQPSNTVKENVNTNDIMTSSISPSKTTENVQMSSYIKTTEVNRTELENYINDAKEKCPSDPFEVKCSDKTECCQGIGNTNITLVISKSCQDKLKITIDQVKGTNQMCSVDFVTTVCKCGASGLTTSFAIIVLGLLIHFY